jgi:hypothetical protein
MCDYSLHAVSNRLAEENEQLIVQRFHTGSLGLASPAELLPRNSPPIQPWKGFWNRIREWFSESMIRPECAVCVPPGARLLLEDIPQRLQQQLGISDTEEVTFTQLSADPYSYRDAVRFSNGREVLLQRLQAGQRMRILSLALTEELTPQESEVRSVVMRH